MPARDPRHRRGRLGEIAARQELERRGYRILAENYRCMAGETDLVAEEGETLVFVEVKTRGSLSHGLPREAVTPQKQRRLGRAAMAYCSEHDLGDRGCRFDVVEVLMDGDRVVHVELLQNAFVPPAEEEW